jgi:chromate transporter
LPAAEYLLYGVRPVVIAVVAQALWKLGRSAIKTRLLGFVALGCVLLSAVGINELLVLLIGGIVSLAANKIARREMLSRTGLPAMPLIKPILFTGAAVATAYSINLWTIFLAFAKIGSVLFGSGYVLLAFLRADLLERYHWLTERQLLDAVAVGQVTPGPVFTAATFIGYLLRGWQGGLVATAGIFLPAFVFVAATAPLLPWLRSSKVAASVLDGVNVASLALMAVVTWHLAHSSIVDSLTLIFALAAAVALLLLKLNSAWLVLLGASAGLLTHALHPH